MKKQSIVNKFVPVFAKMGAITCTLLTICGTIRPATAQTAPRYFGQYVTGIVPTDYASLTDSGVVYSAQDYVGDYGRWENGVGVMLHRPVGIHGLLFAANSAGMILWASPYNGNLLQYADGTYSTITSLAGGISGNGEYHPLNNLGTVAISGSPYLSSVPLPQITNPLTGFSKVFIPSQMSGYVFKPVFVNNLNNAVGTFYDPHNQPTSFAIYRPSLNSAPQLSDFEIVQAPTYSDQYGIQHQYGVDVKGFNDHNEVVGYLDTFRNFIYLPVAKYGLPAGITILSSLGIRGFNNKGQILLWEAIFQNGVEYPLSRPTGAGPISFNNAGQILCLIRSPERHEFYLLTQYVNVLGHLDNPGTPPVSMTVTFQSQDGSAPVTRTVTPNANGDFVIQNVPTREYSALFTVPGRLRRRLTIDATLNNDDINIGTLRLPVGDANGDDAVDISDLLILIAHYNQVSPDAGYLEACDFNRDGANDIADLLLLIGDYNQTGS